MNIVANLMKRRRYDKDLFCLRFFTNMYNHSMNKHFLFVKGVGLMEKIFIEGGHKLKGQVQISGAKNSAVALVPAAILADSDVIIDGMPNISDVFTLGKIIESLGGKIAYESENESNQTIHIDPQQMALKQL